MRELRALIARNRAGSGEALPSVCSAHPDVIAASALLAEELDAPLLIEATSNQVNQHDGYTGMKPADFIAFVRAIARENSVSEDRLLFGGDHLGPQVWRARPADAAMAEARELVAAYVRAGFTKIHLDCSEGCAGEPAQVSDAVSAARAAELAQVCEQAAADPETLSYMYGTEVPPPGGARVEEGGQGIEPTSPDSARATIAAHKREFAARGLDGAWERAVGLVVQPGLEFAPDHIHHFDLGSPDRLSPVLEGHPGLSFEAHSTDYQNADVYPALGRRHFAVLKVGPALTFAYRQAVYALDAIADWLAPDSGRPPVPETMEGLMLANPANWQKHYAGSEEQLHLLRHFSYADRIRYYWPQPAAVEAINELLGVLDGPPPPAPLIEQYFAPQVVARAAGLLEQGYAWPRALIFAQVQDMLAPYYAALRQDA